MGIDFSQHYGFHRPLFAPVLETYDVFEAGSRKLLLDDIIAQLSARRMVVSVEGERGVGKSTLAAALALTLQARQCSIIQVMSALRDPMQVQLLLGGLFGLAADGPVEPDKLRQAAEAAGIGQVVLLVDDADELASVMFRYLWLIVKLFEHSSCRVQVVLIGGLEEWEGLAEPDLEPLSRCLDGQRCILPFTDAEAEAYLDFKIRSAGGVLTEVLDRDALAVLLQEGDGNPSRINALTERALALGTRRGRRLTASTIRAAAGLASASPATGRATSRLALMLFGLVVVAAIGAGAVVGLQQQDRAPEGPAIVPEAESVPRAFTPPPLASLAEPPAPIESSPAPTPSSPGRRAPGLVLVAQSGDTMPMLFAQVYRGLVPPAYADFVALNQAPLRPGALVVFPTPPKGWPTR